MKKVKFEIKVPHTKIYETYVNTELLKGDYLNDFKRLGCETPTYKYLTLTRNSDGIFYKVCETIEEARQTVKNLLK